MNGILIKKEFLAQRCEICHQSDLYNAEKIFCARCKDIVIKRPSTKVSIREGFASLNPNAKVIVISPIIGASLSFFTVIIALVFAEAGWLKIDTDINPIGRFLSWIMVGAMAGFSLGISSVITIYTSKKIYHSLKKPSGF